MAMMAAKLPKQILIIEIFDPLKSKWRHSFDRPHFLQPSFSWKIALNAQQYLPNKNQTSKVGWSTLNSRQEPHLWPARLADQAIALCRVIAYGAMG
jgi:hypothetical protein